MENTTAEFFEQLDNLYAAGNMDDVEQFLQMSGRRYRPCCGGFSANYLAVLSELGGFYRGTSKYAASVEAFRAARDIISEFIGQDTIEYATNLNNMAGTYRLMGENEKSLQLFSEAIEIYRRTIGTQNYLFASALNNVALLYQKTQEYKKATECLEQALTILKALPNAEADIATTYNNLAAHYDKMGNHDQANAALQEALRLFKSSASDSPHYAAALNLSATFAYKAGAYEKAAELYLQTLGTVDRFFGHNIEYGIACENLARVCEKLHNFDEAEKYMQEALHIYNAVYGKDHPTSTKAIASLKDLEAKRNACTL